MKRLVNTQLFCMLNNIERPFDPGEYDIGSLYEDFVDRITNLCLSEESDIPTYFTIHYTRLELERFQMSLGNKGAGEKMLRF